MKSDPIEHLKFVHVKDQNGSMIWWPSLVCDSFQELLSHFNHEKRIQGKMFLLQRKLQKEKKSLECSWAYLLGKVRPCMPIIAIDRTTVDSTVKEFVAEIDGMEVLYSKQQHWDDALNHGIGILTNSVTNTTFNIDVFEDDVFNDAFDDRFTNNKNVTSDKTKTTNHLKRKRNSPKEMKSTKTEKKNKKSGNSNNSSKSDESRITPKFARSQDQSKNIEPPTLVPKGKKSSTAMEDDDSGDENERRSSPRLKNAITSEGNKKSKSKPSSATEKAQKSRQSKAKKNKSIHSKTPLSTPYTDDNTHTTPSTNLKSKQEKSQRLTQITPTSTSKATQATQTVTPGKKKNANRKNGKRPIPKDAEWTEVMNILIEYGYYFVKASSPFFDYYWVSGAHTGVDSETYIQEQLKDGVDYFKGEEELKSFVHNKYGWVGPAGKEFQPLKPRRSRIKPQQNSQVSGTNRDLKKQDVFTTQATRSEHKSPEAASGKQKSSKKDKDEKTQNNPAAPVTSKRKIPKDAEWTEVMNILIEYGFYYVKASRQFFDYYWVSGAHKDVESEQYIQEHLKDGVDYFKGEEELKSFIHTNYGWVGPAGKEFHPTMSRRSRMKPQQNSHAPETIKKKKTENVSTTQATSSKRKSAKRDKDEKKPNQSIAAGNNSKRNSSETVGKENTKRRRTDKRTVKERLNECIAHLDVSNVSDDILFFGDGHESSSELSMKQDSIFKFLHKSVSSNNTESSLMYICGNPGMGKTTLVKYCVNEIVKHDSNIHALFLNSASLASPDAILGEMSKIIGKKTKSTTPDSIGQALLKSSKQNKTQIVFVLDEIDFLLKGIGNKKKAFADSTLGTVLSWASDPLYRLTLIGISNSVGSSDARLLHKFAKVGEELVFVPYREEDLKGIVLRRLGTNKVLIEEKAIEYATKKISKSNGDARAVLDLFSKALQKCKMGLSQEMMNSTNVEEPVLKMVHVLQALRNAGVNLSIVDLIKSLPQKVKTLLCVASAINQVSDSWKDIPLAKLKSYCHRAVQHGLMDDLSLESFTGMVQRLEDDGLFCTGQVDEFAFSSHYDVDFMERTIRVGAQLEDVECAIEETLLQNNFYKGIVENIKKMGIESM